jgi:hypothetical protein
MGARHFTDAQYQAWAAGRPDGRLTGKLSRQVAHLTYDRTSDNAQKIGARERQELFDLICREAMTNFQTHLRKPYKDKWPAQWNVTPNLNFSPDEPPSATNAFSEIKADFR